MIRISPSKLEAVEICPCFEQKDRLDEDTSDPKNPKTMGIRLHAAMETGDLTKCLDEEELWWVQWATQQVDSLRQGLPPGDFVEFAEVDLDGAKADKIFLIAPGGGEPVGCLVLDYKFGRKATTPAEDNIQGWAYLAKCMEKWVSLQFGTICFISPLLREVSQARFDRSWLDIYSARVAKILGEVNDPFKKPRNSDPDTCSGCKHRDRCPAWNQLQVATVNHLCREASVSVQDIFDLSRPVSCEVRRVRQALSDFFDKWRKDVRADNLAAVKQQGLVIPGYSLVSRAASPSIPKELTYSVWARVQSTVSLADFLSTCEINFKQLCEQYALVSAQSPGQARELLLSLLNGLVSATNTPITFLTRKKRKEDTID